jgi:hypothetical protein
VSVALVADWSFQNLEKELLSEWPATSAGEHLMKKLQLCCWALVCGAFILMSWVAQGLRAQEVTAAVTGTVTDPSGKFVAGAAVTAKSVERGLTYTTETNDSGNPSHWEKMQSRCCRSEDHLSGWGLETQSHKSRRRQLPFFARSTRSPGPGQTRKIGLAGGPLAAAGGRNAAFPEPSDGSLHHDRGGRK